MNTNRAPHRSPRPSQGAGACPDDFRWGSLCTGYGGLDTAAVEVFGGTVAWHCQYDPDDQYQYAAQVLTRHWPDTPNHGDITTVDYTQVEPVDGLTAGFPCQDVSLAGLRAGIADGTRSGLWLHVARAIKELQPRLVVIENVRGLLSQKADRGLGPDAPDMDPATGARFVLRALGAVLGDLAGLGFDAEWAVVRASEIGAPHQRERVFILAWPAAADPDNEGTQRAGQARRAAERHASGEDREPPNAQGSGPQGSWLRGHAAERGEAAEDADGAARGERRLAAPGQEEGRGARADSGGRGRVPAAERGGREAAADTDRNALREQPVGESGRGGAPVTGQLGSGASADAQGDGRDEGRTESAGQQGRSDAAIGGGADIQWGDYETAVRQWEYVLGRPAPRPTDDRGRLSPPFVEWLMGLPAGHVTDTPGLPRSAQLKALGNGVVPQQAAAAIQLLAERAGVAR